MFRMLTHTNSLLLDPPERLVHDDRSSGRIFSQSYLSGRPKIPWVHFSGDGLGVPEDSIWYLFGSEGV